MDCPQVTGKSTQQTLAEQAMEEARRILGRCLLSWSCSRVWWNCPWRGIARGLGPFAVEHILMPALERFETIAQRGMARGQFELVADFAVQALQVIALPRQLG